MGTTDAIKVPDHPLALPQPSYASIASQEISKLEEDLQLSSPADVIVLKPAFSTPLVINVEEKNDLEEDTKDNEGFIEIATKKIKKERRLSRKISYQESEEVPNVNNKTETLAVEPVTKESKQIGISLPISEMTETWMDDGIIGISDDDDAESESTEDEKLRVSAKISAMEQKLENPDQCNLVGIHLPI